MKKTNQLLTSVLTGVVIAGAGLVLGQANAQAATKVTQNVTVKAIKGLKTSKVTFKNVTATVNGPKVTVATPKVKGYVPNNAVYAFKAVRQNGKNKIVAVNQPSYFNLHYYKLVAAKAQKSSQAIKATGYYLIQRNGLFGMKATVKAVPGTVVKVKVPKLKGYARNSAVVYLGMNAKNAKYAFNNITLPIYTKVKGYKVSVKATKKASNIKVNGKLVVNNQKQAKAHPAKYAIIHDQKGKTVVKLNQANKFSTTLKKRAAVNKLTVTAAYRTKNAKKSNGKTTYTYHAVSAKKNVTVNTVK